jgi:hypothetical protein
MTAVAVPADIVPPRPGWHALLWIVPLALLWILLIYWQPIISASGAVPAAIAVATGTAQGRRAAIAWNILGLADFSVAITLGAITSPGPFQLIVPDVPSIGAGAYPGVLTPALVVPSSILLHALSLRQLRRRSRSDVVKGAPTHLDMGP